MESYKGTIRNTLWLQKRPSPLMGACVIPAVLCRIAWSVLVWVSPFCILMHRHDLNSPGGTVERVIFPSDIFPGKTAVSRSSPFFSSCDLAGPPQALPHLLLPRSRERITCWEGVCAHWLREARCTSSVILPVP